MGQNPELRGETITGKFTIIWSDLLKKFLAKIWNLLHPNLIKTHSFVIAPKLYIERFQNRTKLEAF